MDAHTTRAPRKVMFDSKDAKYEFLRYLNSFTADISPKFGYAVRKAFDQKITSDESLPTYYLTKADIQRIAKTFM